MLLYTGDIGIHGAYIMAPMIPIFQYIIIGNFYYFILQAILQLVFLNTIFDTLMQHAVTYEEPENFMQGLRTSVCLNLVIYCGLAVIMSHLMIRTIKRIWSAEKKKVEFENQKNFLLGFSHELRNLINSLAGNVKLASLEPGLSDKAKDLLTTAEVCGELLLHLVNNILDTGKVEIGELEVDPRPTKIYDALERIWGICSELIKRKGLRGRMLIQRDIPKSLMIDHYRLTQIILNLVGNAIKFTDRGSITINVQWNSDVEEVGDDCFEPYPYNEDDEQDEGLFEKRQSFSRFDEEFLVLNAHNSKVVRNNIRLPLTQRNGVLKITIVDTGCEMTREQTSQLFQRFTQVTSDISKKKLGTGLGLFISRQLCQKMKGEIRVYSKEDKGSCFSVCIPLDRVQGQNEHLMDAETIKARVKDKKLRAMIVDDAQFNHLILTSFFEKLGIEVITGAYNGVEAHEVYVKHLRDGNRPHIVAMDLDMPLLNGKEASYRIRQTERLEGLQPCFLTIVSGNCTESEIAECLNENGRVKAQNFLKKPVNIEELLRVIGHHFVFE